MKKDEIHFTDLPRWLFGQTPPQFMIEVIIRTVLIYIILLFVVRQMGKRMAGQTTLTELAVMVTLGAIVSPVMQLPDRALLFAVIVLLCTYGFQRGVNLWAFKNETVEKITQGKMSLLIRDGTIVLDELKKTRVTRQQLFSLLREKKIQNLAKVERLYLEACGAFSIYESEDTGLGLPVFPPSDPALLNMQQPADAGESACCVCGHVQLVSSSNSTCDLCRSSDWTRAYRSVNHVS
jgi:hypothetical protein